MTRETKGKRLIMPDDILATKGSVGRLKKRVQKLESNPVSSGSGAVDSVFTRTGDVVAVANDYAHAQVSGLFGYYQSSTADIPQSRITGLFGYYQPSATFAENVSDQVGTMVTGNTETNITVTYQDADNTLDFVVADATTAVKGAASFNSTDFSVSAGAVSILAERIQDLAGAMVTGNTETNITVTYQDADGTI